VLLGDEQRRLGEQLAHDGVQLRQLVDGGVLVVEQVEDAGARLVVEVQAFEVQQLDLGVLTGPGDLHQSGVDTVDGTAGHEADDEPFVGVLHGSPFVGERCTGPRRFSRRLPRERTDGHRWAAGVDRLLRPGSAA
jgi:hypothetical protein